MALEIVLVTGGQGFLGQHIIRLLQQDEQVAEIRVLDVNKFTNRIGFEDRKPLKSYVGDITQPKTLVESFNGVDCVIHCAASTGFHDFGSPEELDEVNVKGTLNVIEQCIAANIGRLIYSSTALVSIPMKDPLILATEHTAQIPPGRGYLFGDYARTKFEAECLIRKANRNPLSNGNGTLSTVCLRPTVLYGELDPYFVTHGLRTAHRNGGILQQFGWGGQRVQVTYAGNAAWAHVLAKNQLKNSPKEIAGEAIFITDDTVIENPFHFMEVFLKERSMALSTYEMPAALAVIISIVLTFFGKLLKPSGCVNSPFLRPTYFFVCLYCFNRLKAILRLGYKPLYNQEQSLTNSSNYYRKITLE